MARDWGRRRDEEHLMVDRAHASKQAKTKKSNEYSERRCVWLFCLVPFFGLARSSLAVHGSILLLVTDCTHNFRWMTVDKLATSSLYTVFVLAGPVACWLLQLIARVPPFYTLSYTLYLHIRTCALSLCIR